MATTFGDTLNCRANKAPMNEACAQHLKCAQYSSLASPSSASFIARLGYTVIVALLQRRNYIRSIIIKPAATVWAERVIDEHYILLHAILNTSTLLAFNAIAQVYFIVYGMRLLFLCVAVAHCDEQHSCDAIVMTLSHELCMPCCGFWRILMPLRRSQCTKKKTYAMTYTIHKHCKKYAIPKVVGVAKWPREVAANTAVLPRSSGVSFFFIKMHATHGHILSIKSIVVWSSVSRIYTIHMITHSSGQ